MRRPARGQVGPYVLEEELGRGGVGVVYRARDPARGGPVAVKVLPDAGADPVRLRRFQQEVQALVRLRHPGIAAVLDAGEHGGVPFLVVEYVHGPSLAARLDGAGPLEPRAATRLALSLTEALAHAHAQGVLHRDVKPANILLHPDGRPLLVDFGLARDLDPGASRLTRSGQVLGTLGFCAPEQVRGDRARLGPATDVYGVGATLYAMLTGRPPVEAESAVEALVATERGAIPPPSRLRPGVPAALEAVVLRCLARDPADRYPTADALTAALRGALRQLERRPRGGRRRPLAAAAGLLALALAAAGLLAARGPRPAAPAPTPPSPTPPSPTPPPPTPPAAVGPSAADRAEAERLVDEARGLRRSGDRAGARGAIDRAVALDPGSGRAWNVRAVVREEQGDPEGALDDYARAAACEPPFTDALYNGALLRAGRRDFAGALADAERLAAVAPERAPDALVLRAIVLEGQGQPEEALAALQRSLDLRPTAAAYVERARQRLSRGDPDRALDDLRRAQDLLPPDDPQRAEVTSLLGAAETLRQLRGAAPR